MKRDAFLAAIIDAVQTEQEVTKDTVLADVQEWDSLAAVTVLVLYSKHLKLKVQAENLKDCKTFGDLLKLGDGHYDA